MSNHMQKTNIIPHLIIMIRGLLYDVRDLTSVGRLTWLLYPT